MLKGVELLSLAMGESTREGGLFVSVCKIQLRLHFVQFIVVCDDLWLVVSHFHINIKHLINYCAP